MDPIIPGVVIVTEATAARRRAIIAQCWTAATTRPRFAGIPPAVVSKHRAWHDEAVKRINPRMG